MQIFSNRTQAGKLLAKQLTAYANRKDVLILALPRGGVPVGYEIAKKIHAPLDVFLVRKLGVPGYEELAMGAIALNDIVILNEDIMQSMQISYQAMQSVLKKEKNELARRNFLYRSDRPTPNIENKIVLLVDDGLATGATMRTAITAIKILHPKKIVVAAPIAASAVYHALAKEVDQIICLETPINLSSIGSWYKDFTQVADEEVLTLLKKSLI